jgi:hypothetical protein
MHMSSLYFLKPLEAHISTFSSIFNGYIILKIKPLIPEVIRKLPLIIENGFRFMTSLNLEETLDIIPLRVSYFSPR